MAEKITAANGRSIAPGASWFSIPDLAGLPGMPGTVRGAHRRAEANQWKGRERSFGKGLEYRRSDLPAETQLYLATLASVLRGSAPERTSQASGALGDIAAEWALLNTAISQMLEAPPSRLTAAALDLDLARKSFEKRLRSELGGRG